MKNMIKVLCMSMLFLVLLQANDSLKEEQKPENASNPLAAVSNVDLIATYFDLDEAHLKKYSLEGSTMINPKLKFKYEVRYWDTDVSGENEQALESTSLKLIYFPKEGKTDSGKPYRLAVGVEWIKDFDNTDKGIGTGSDILSVFGGVAIGLRPGLMLIPLVQHYEDYSGNEFRQTAGRVIALQELPQDSWAKLDLQVPYDWNTHKVESAFEMQIGKSFTKAMGVYIDLQAGLGVDKFYETAAGLGLRYNF